MDFNTVPLLKTESAINQNPLTYPYAVITHFTGSFSLQVCPKTV